MKTLARCWLCLQPLAISHHGLCSYCLPYVLTSIIRCKLCGLPKNPTLACQFCQNIHPIWDALITVTDYHPPMSDWIHQFKFKKNIALMPMLARLLLLRWLQSKREYQLNPIDLILTIPLHKTRYWTRGFNQTALLAKKLSRWLVCPFSEHTLRKIKVTKPQLSLTAFERKNNLTNSFICCNDISGKTILLLDDIVTTTATIHEICRLLHSHHVKCIYILCLSRTL